MKNARLLGGETHAQKEPGRTASTDTARIDSLHAYSNRSCTDLSADAQRSRLLERLRKGPVTTLEARRELEVLAPAARIWELRARGYVIDTVRVSQATETGIKHNVAMYVLRSEPQATATKSGINHHVAMYVARSES